jgi:integrase
MRLTAKAIDLPLPEGKLDHIEFDDDIPGFGLRIREGGSRTWVFQYKLGGKQRRMVLGRATAIKAEKARSIASEYHEQVGKGRDPAGEKAVRKVQAADTLDELVRRYLEVKKDELRPRSYAEVARHLEVYTKPLHRLPLSSIDRTIVSDRLNQVAKDSGAVTANRMRASLSAMFVWGMTEELAAANPVISTRKREEKSRDRVLSDAELKVIWNSVENDHYGAIIKLLMLTGQRANEIAGLRWSEIDFDRGVILLPAERTKNGRAHQVPMSGTVVEILGDAGLNVILEAQPRTAGRDLVFGYGEGPFSGWSKSKEKLDGAIGDSISAHWVPHDLRRTCATRMADLGVQPHVIEAVLNHVSGHRAGVAGIYNRAMYAAEKAQALDLWADYIAAVLAGRKSNITSLRRA